MLKEKMPLVIAGGLAILAGVLAFTAIKNKEQSIQAGWTLKEVIVALEDIQEGTVVTDDMWAVRQMPERFLGASNIRRSDVNNIRNQKILVNVQAGEPLLWSQFSMAKSVERLSSKVLKRMRVFTLSVNNSSSVGGWIRPNDRVDIIGLFKDSQSQEQFATTIMQNVVVLATGAVTGTTNVMLVSEQDRRYSEVSLMVLPEDVERLALAQEMGTLTFSLRNEDDAEVISAPRTNSSALLNQEVQKSLETKRNRMIDLVPSSSGVAR